MKTTEIIVELKAHLALHVEQRDPRTSDKLMGWAMVQLKEAHEIIQEVACPSKFIPTDAFTKADLADRDERRRQWRDFLA
jgi:hypothetical protein